MTIDYQYFKKKLEVEKKLLAEELEKVGRRNPDNLSDWEATPTDRDSSQADENTLADSIEEYEENIAIVGTLESRYQDLRDALNKIEKGNYGLCEICNEPIDDKRLEANPSAKECRKHMK